MKLLFDSLDALLAELRDRKIGIVRVSPAVEIETGGSFVAPLRDLFARRARRMRTR